MHQSDTRRSYLLRRKPKSWILIVASGLFGFLIGGPFLLAGRIYAIDSLQQVGMGLFRICWAIAVVMLCVYLWRLATGAYKNIDERDWNEQLW